MAEKKKEAKQVPVRLATAEEKKKALDAAIAHIEKTYGKGAVMKLGKAPDYNVDVIPTGSMTLDMALFFAIFLPFVMPKIHERYFFMADMLSILYAARRGDRRFVPLLVIGVSYFLVRILGKYAGAWLGCRLVKKDRLVRNYLGLALIPQAGVAIGLAALGARTLGGTMGSDLQTIILASSVLYELIGPGCAKLALYLSKSYSTKLEDVAVVAEVTETGEQKSDVQLLIERIRKIQSELPPLESDVSEEEAAFTEAAEEQLAQTQAQRRYFYLRR